ncbi:MAG: hypothetical protein AB1815_10690, partial [Bacillota bacterium]
MSTYLFYHREALSPYHKGFCLTWRNPGFFAVWGSQGDCSAASIPSLFITELIRPKTPASVGGGFQRAVKSSMDSANIQRGLNPPLNE